MAIQINQNKNYKLSSSDNSSNADKVNAAAWLEGLEMIPDYDVSEMSLTHFIMVRRYLNKAFNSPIHPFSQLLDTLCDCYTATYGGVRIHPLLLTHAVKELSAIVRQLYSMIRTFFPALPKDQVLQVSCHQRNFPFGNLFLLRNGDPILKMDWIPPPKKSLVI